MSRETGKSILGRVCRASIVASGTAALLIACGGGGDSTGSPAGAPRAAPADAATVAPGGGTPTAGIDPDLIPSEDLPEAQTDGPPASADRGDSDGTTPEQPAQAVSENGTKGQWSAVSSWPIIAIHAVLTPNGKVMTYGTDQAGAQGSQLVYDVWDPATGGHSLLPNTTGTDIFCNAQLVLPDSGKVLLAGGDIRGQGLPNGFGGILINRGVRDVNLFDARDLTLSASGTPMTYARWYASLTTLSDGRVLTLGGTDGSGGAVLTPEIFNGIGAGWTPLSGARYAGYKFYPRSFLAPNGKVVIASDTRLFSLDPNGVGSIQAVGTLPNEIRWDLPTAMFARGKVLTQNLDGTASVIDMNGLTPSVRNVESGGTNRHWATMTVLPDGQVLNTGGGAAPINTGRDLALNAAIWNPATERWTSGASAVKGREYHSIALLLPDATVLVAGGGAPGPVNQFNAEIYSPPYLFAKDGSGSRLSRPVLLGATPEVTMGSTPVRMGVVSRTPIQRVTLVRTGSVTHSINFDQRFLEVPFTQSGATLDITIDESSNVLPPGHYMLFAFDADGVPSIAKIVKIAARPV